MTKVNQFGEILGGLMSTERTRLLRMAVIHMPCELRKLVSAEDVLQETSMYLLSHPPCDEDVKNIPPSVIFRSAMLETIARLAKHYFETQKRSARRIAPMTLDELTTRAHLRWENLAKSISSPYSKLGDVEELERIDDVVSRLPEREQEIIALRFDEGLTFPEIAAVLNIQTKAATMRFVRAAQHVVALLKEENHERT